MSKELITEVLEGLESKEGVMLLITQMIKDETNDQELGKSIRKNFKNYFLEQE